MGNSNNSNDKHNTPGLTQYQRFGDVIIRQSLNPQIDGQQCSQMIIKKIIQSQKVYKQWKDQLTRILDSQTRQVFLLPSEHKFEKNVGMCTSSGTLTLTMPNHPFLLSTQLQNRNNLGSYFSQQQIWYLLYVFIRAGARLQKLGFKVGDISTNNIVIDQDGVVRVIGTFTMPGQLNGYQKVVQDPLNAKVFLAPQQLVPQLINTGTYPPKIDPCKAQVFSIGLTLLSCGTLKSLFDLYGQSYSSINNGLLNANMNGFSNRYSPYLSKMVANMIQIKPQNRRSCSQLYKQLVVHQQKILDLQGGWQNQNSNIKQSIGGINYNNYPTSAQNSGYIPYNNTQNQTQSQYQNNNNNNHYTFFQQYANSNSPQRRFN